MKPVSTFKDANKSEAVLCLIQATNIKFNREQISQFDLGWKKLIEK